LDAHNVFLNDDLTEHVLMSQPPGFVNSDHPNHVCLLSKALYGLKQSSRGWFNKLSFVLLKHGFTASCYDPSLFISHSHVHTTILLVYVNDILITGSNNAHINQCISHLQQAFSLKDLGPLSYFLGIEAHPSSIRLLISQTKYLTEILNRTHMQDAKPSPTPMASNSTLFNKDSAPFEDPRLYRSIVGALQYANITRPDPFFTVNKVS
jgi:Reverse transcriptase (RNA-dependent DNA polymerase)